MKDDFDVVDVVLGYGFIGDMVIVSYDCSRWEKGAGRQTKENSGG